MSAVLVIGDVINDVVVRPDRPPASDTDTPSAIAAVPGGSGANQAAWLAAAGVSARLAARVGAADAATHRAALLAAGVDARLSEDPAIQTGSIVILVGAGGTRSMFTDRGANRALDAQDLDPGLLDGMDHLHVSGYALLEERTRRAVTALWQAAGAARLTRSADPGSVGFLGALGPGAFLEATRGADVLFPNEAEARFLAGADDAHSAASRLAGPFPLILIKRGAGGVLVAGPDGIQAVAAQAVPVTDPTGTGDAFAAGFLASWLAGSPPVAAAAAGVDLAARALQHVGGRPPASPPAAAGWALPWDQLRAAARAIASRAYAPWSGLSVGAAGLTDDGRIVTGTNVENASYGLTLCAECGLVSALRAAGGRALVAVAVVAGDGQPLAPCGRCRQLLVDNGGTGLLLDAGPGRPPVTLASLLPGAFDAVALAERRQR